MYSSNPVYSRGSSVQVYKKFTRSIFYKSMRVMCFSISIISIISKNPRSIRVIWGTCVQWCTWNTWDRVKILWNDKKTKHRCERLKSEWKNQESVLCFSCAMCVIILMCLWEFKCTMCTCAMCVISTWSTWNTWDRWVLCYYGITWIGVNKLVV